MKQQAIDILDEMIEERTPYKEDIPLHKTLGYEVCHGGYIALEEAKSRIQALGDGCEVQTLKIGDECYFSNNCITWRKGIFNGYASGRYTLHNFAMKNMPLPLPPVTK